MVNGGGTSAIASSLRRAGANSTVRGVSAIPYCNIRISARTTSSLSGYVLHSLTPKLGGDHSSRPRSTVHMYEPKP